MKSKSYIPAEQGHWKVAGRNKKILSLLDDLIRINIDRIGGYEKAAHEETTEEPEVRDMFYRLAIDSRANVNTLHAEVIRLGGSPVTQSTITGKIYLHWLEGRNGFDGTDTPARLSACARTELAVQKAYEQALAEQTHLEEKIVQLLENQLWALERAQQRLVELKDGYPENK